MEPTVNEINSEELLCTDDAARVLGLQPVTLHCWRYRGTGPGYVKLGGKIRYRRIDLKNYLRRCVVTPRPRRAEAAVS